jgi:hypothetical protein
VLRGSTGNCDSLTIALQHRRLMIAPSAGGCKRLFGGTPGDADRSQQ